MYAPHTKKSTLHITSVDFLYKSTSTRTYTHIQSTRKYTYARTVQRFLELYCAHHLIIRTHAQYTSVDLHSAARVSIILVCVVCTPPNTNTKVILIQKYTYAPCIHVRTAPHTTHKSTRTQVQYSTDLLNYTYSYLYSFVLCVRKYSACVSSIQK